MHSKVIIASLVCMLAASFNCNKTVNVAEASNLGAEEAVCANAPNEDRRAITFSQDIVDCGSPFVASFGIYASESLYNSFHRWLNPSNLIVERFFYSSGCLGAYIESPTSNGETFISFIAGGKEYGTIYIYTQNGHSCASSLSANDARAKYFMEFVATNSEKNYYPCSSPTSIKTSAGYNAVKHYSDYVYGSSDISASVTAPTKTTSGETGIPVIVHVDWKQSSTYYDFSSMSLNFYLNGVPITTYAYRTNIYGLYSITLSASQIRNKRISDLQIGLFADTTATVVKDNNGFNYPCLYNYSSSTLLSSVTRVEYHLTFTPSVSDRSSSYIIAQAEIPARWYLQLRCNNRYVPVVETRYPTAKIQYYGETLHLRKGISSSWDVIGHEYCHYICDKFNLCGDFHSYSHKYNEDLSIYNGYDEGSRFAYSEGLATYFALASLVEYGRVFGGYANSIADYKYDDNLNNIHVNYSSEKYGSPNSPHGTCVEASVTRILVKMLTTSSIGYAKMVNIIFNGDGPRRNIVDFTEDFIHTYKQDAACVYPVLDSENISEQYVALNGFRKIDEWTIMVYACPSTNLSTTFTKEIDSMLAASGQPNDVNIIVKIDGHAQGTYDYSSPSGFYIDPRFGYELHVEDSTTVIDSFGLRDNMGDPDTLVDFVDRCIQNYPAKKMGLILFNHGDALDGVCHDTHFHDDLYGEFNDPLYNSEVELALDTIFEHNNLFGKFEFIGYDACLMQVQDVADFNSKYFNYMVASEEYTYGWDWSGFLEDIYNRCSTVSALTTLCEDFIPKNDEIFISKNEERKACLSVLDLSKMKAYRNKLETLAINIKNTVTNHRDEFLSVIDQSMHFANIVNLVEPEKSQYKYEKFGTIDGYDFLTKLAESPSFAQYSSQINQVIAAYSDVVIVNRKALESTPTYGLSMHVCLHEYEQQKYRVDETHFHNWRNLFCIDERNYTYSFVTQDLHVKVCDCGYYELEEHTIDDEWWENGHHYGYCSVCDTTFMYQN